jgi:hypothetical protein
VAKFFVSLALATVGISAAVLKGAGQDTFPEPSFFTVTLLLLFVFTALSFVLLYKAKEPSAFLQSYLLTTTVKLLGYGGYILIIIFSDRGGATANVLFFMLTYLVFTVLEIVFLYRKFSRSRGR